MTEMCNVESTTAGMKQCNDMTGYTEQDTELTEENTQENGYCNEAIADNQPCPVNVDDMELGCHLETKLGNDGGQTELANKLVPVDGDDDAAGDLDADSSLTRSSHGSEECLEGNDNELGDQRAGHETHDNISQTDETTENKTTQPDADNKTPLLQMNREQTTKLDKSNGCHSPEDINHDIYKETPVKPEKPDNKSLDDIPGKKSLSGRLRSWRAEAEPRTAWIMLFLSIMPIYVIVGIEWVSFSMYYVEYAVYFTDSSMSAIAFIPAIKISGMCVFGLVVSALVRLHGIKPVTMAGGIMMFLAFFLSAFAPNIYMLYVTQGLLLGFGCSCALISTAFATQGTFSTNRAMAASLGMCGMSIGNMIGPPCVNLLIQNYGWRGALAIQAAISAHFIPFSALMSVLAKPNKPVQATNGISRKNSVSIHRTDGNQEIDGTSINETNISQASDKDQDIKVDTSLQDKISCCARVTEFTKSVFDFSLFKHVPFALICICGPCDRFVTQVFISHMPNRAIYLGMSRVDAATFMSVSALSILVGRLLMSFLANFKIVNRVLLYGVGCAYGGMHCFFIVIFNSYTGQMIGSVLRGLHAAITNTILNVALVDLVGVPHLPRALALYNLCVTVTSMIAAPLAGYLYDVTKSYDPPFLLAGSVGLFGGLWGISSAVMQKRNKRKHTEIALQRDIELCNEEKELTEKDDLRDENV